MMGSYDAELTADQRDYLIERAAERRRQWAAHGLGIAAHLTPGERRHMTALAGKLNERAAPISDADARAIVEACNRVHDAAADAAIRRRLFARAAKPTRQRWHDRLRRLARRFFVGGPM